MRTALDGQVAYKLEVTPGTAVTPNVCIPWREVSGFWGVPDITHDPATIAGRRYETAEQRALGIVRVGGKIGTTLYNQGLEDMLTMCHGSVAKTTPGLVQRVYTSGPLDGKAMTIQGGFPDTGGTNRPVTAAGCKVTGWEFAIAAKEYVTFGIDAVGMTSTTATSKVTNSILAGTKGFHFRDLTTFTVDGTSVKFPKLTCKANLGLDVGREFAGQSYIDEPLESDLRSIVMNIDTEFISLAEYNRFISGDELTIVLVLSNGTESFRIDANGHYEGGDPDMKGKGRLMQSIPLHINAAPADTDANAWTVTLLNSVA